MSFVNYLAMMKIQNYSGTDKKELDTKSSSSFSKTGVL